LHPRPQCLPYTTLFRSESATVWKGDFRVLRKSFSDGRVHRRAAGEGERLVDRRTFPGKPGIAKGALAPLGPVGVRVGENPEFHGDRKSTRLNSSHLGIS